MAQIGPFNFPIPPYNGESSNQKTLRAAARQRITKRPMPTQALRNRQFGPGPNVGKSTMLQGPGR